LPNGSQQLAVGRALGPSEEVAVSVAVSRGPRSTAGGPRWVDRRRQLASSPARQLARYAGEECHWQDWSPDAGAGRSSTDSTTASSCPSAITSTVYVIAFTARATPGCVSRRVPKYLNAPTTPLYRNSDELLGLYESGR